MSRMVTPEMRLLEILRRSDEPALLDSERVRRKIALELTLSAGAATTLVATQKGSWLLGSSSFVAWFKGATVAVSLVALGTGAAYYLRPPAPRHAERTRPVIPAQPANVVAAAAPSAAEQTTTATATATTTASQADPLIAETTRAPKPLGSSVAPKASARSSSGSLEAELKLIGQAQKALTSGQPNEALRVLDEHQRKFPAGALSFERAGVRTVALCQAGRFGEGRSAAISYLRKVPNSVLSRRIRVACQLADE